MDVAEEITGESVPEKDPWKEDESSTISAQELFSYCDLETKGFITRIDMGRLCNIAPFNREQVEQMFENMDKGKNGEIDLCEFTSGFNALVEISSSPDFRRLKKRMHTNGRPLSPIKEMNIDSDEEIIDVTCHEHLLKSDERLRKMLNDLKTENPSLIPEFERLMTKILSEFETHDEQRNKLEFSFRTCSNLQAEQLEQLYENLERRMEEEKSKSLAEQKTRNDKLNRRLQEELQMKECLVNEIKSQQKEMRKKISELISEGTGRKKKNKQLLKERNELERKVSSTEKMLGELEIEIKSLSKDSLETKKRRERSLNSLSEQISLEEELMEAQINTLRRHNNRLLDENDTKSFFECSHDHSTLCVSRIKEKNTSASDDGNEDLDNVEENERKDSFLSNDLPNSERIPLQGTNMLHRTYNSALSQSSSSSSSSISSALDCIGVPDGHQNTLSPSYKPTWKVTCSLSPQDSEELKAYWKVKLKVVPFAEKMIIHPQIVDNDLNHHLPSDVCDGLIEPERIFKIIFVGDSGVGKTSFIQRFCKDSFKTNFQSTIGIDYQVKSIIVNKRCVSLQLWDTAGQERFRCISKQYFRKSDAVIVMYDVTSEKTFRNIRQWIAHIKENADDGAVILLLGNKVDARRPGEPFIVDRFHGTRLAKEYGALFFETSAKSGTNIYESMVELSSLLQEKEDLDMDKALILNETSQKKKWRC